MELLTSEDLRDAGEALIDATRERLARGLGSDGTPMAPYSAETIRLRTEAGLETSFRDLDASGEMLNARAVTEATPTSVSIGFTDPAAAEKASANEDLTPWVMPTGDELKAAAQLLKQRAVTNLRDGLIEAAKG